MLFNPFHPICQKIIVCNLLTHNQNRCEPNLGESIFWIKLKVKYWLPLLGFWHNIWAFINNFPKLRCHRHNHRGGRVVLSTDTPRGLPHFYIGWVCPWVCLIFHLLVDWTNLTIPDKPESVSSNEPATTIDISLIFPISYSEVDGQLI